MRFVLPAFAKLNLTLRVTGRRADGYHELMSSFLRVPSGETLFVTPGVNEDGVEMTGLDLSFSGENIVSKALRLAREAGAEIPPLRVSIAKALYPGSGLGSGSGNAAAILRCLAPRYPGLPWEDIAGRVGADVSFLFSGLQAARVSGIGERIEPLQIPNLNGCAAFPDWDVGTGSAYAALDAAYPKGYPMNGEDARAELDQILSRLGRGERIGLLPNDFTPPLLADHPRYRELFKLFERAGSSGWGITGSGGAAFALFSGAVPVIQWPEWVRQILIL
jgi:4-diphosphocytidyl-2-C-methyl-D-erythritol kinase